MKQILQLIIAFLCLVLFSFDTTAQKLNFSKALEKQHNEFTENYNQQYDKYEYGELFELWKVHLTKAEQAYKSDKTKMILIKEMNNLVKPETFRDGSDDNLKLAETFDTFIEKAKSIFSEEEIELIFYTPDTEALLLYQEESELNKQK